MIKNINNISSTIDDLFLVDLVRLEKLAEVQLPPQFQGVGELISVVVEGYTTFKSKKDPIKSALVHEIQKIFTFLNDAIVDKFQILKDAQKMLSQYLLRMLIQIRWFYTTKIWLLKGCHYFGSECW